MARSDRADELIEKSLKRALKSTGKAHTRALAVAQVAIQWREALTAARDTEPRSLGFCGEQEVGTERTVVDLVDLDVWDADEGDEDVEDRKVRGFVCGG